jgi:hypothetical protein
MRLQESALRWTKLLARKMNGSGIEELIRESVQTERGINEDEQYSKWYGEFAV